MSTQHRRSLVETFGIDAREREQRRRFIQLGPEDAALLEELAGFVRQHAQRLAEAHYQHIAEFEEPYSQLLSRRDLSQLVEGQAQYFVELFQGTYDEAYFEKRLRLGRAYAGMGMHPKWYVGAYAVYAGLLFPLLLRRYFFRPRKLVRVLLALTRVLNLDQQLAVETYVERVTEELKRVSREVAAIAAQVAATSQQITATVQQSGQAVQQVASTIEQVAQGAAQQTDAISQASAQVDQVAQAIDGIARGAQEQARAVEKAAASVSQMSAQIQQVSGNAQSGAALGQEAAQTARSGAQTVQQAVEAMQAIKEAVSQAGAKVQQMAEFSAQIGAIVETIDDIAAQTNLLALNAAIEAARAGEQGRGFAVVADEVRKLAERSGEATKEIAQLIERVQQGTQEAVEAMEAGLRQVDAGAAQAGEAGEALAEILRGVEQVQAQMAQIAVAAQEMSVASQELVAAMDNVSAIVEENTAATEEVAASSSEIRDAIEQVAGVSQENSAAAQQVSAMTEEMSAQMNEVTASVRSLAQMAAKLHQTVARSGVSQDAGRIARGSALRVRLDFVRTRYGEAALERVLKRLPPNIQTLLRRGIDEHAEYPREVLTALTQAIRDELAGGDPNLAREMAAFLAEYDLRHDLMRYFKAGDPAFTISQMDAIIHHYWGEVPVQVENSANRHLRLRVTRTGNLTPEACRYNLPGWMEGAIRAAGGRPQVRKVKCVDNGDPWCEYEVSW